MQELSLVSLYTGAGGLDYGFERAGFKTRVAVEMDHDCCMTLRRNRDWPIIEKDIQEIGVKELLGIAGLRQHEVDILIGGPPCQPFSKSAYWANGDTKRLDDPRAFTLEEYMRFVREILPKAFLLENVHGISYSGKEEGFRLLGDLTKRINKECGTDYVFSWMVVNAADYGVPQIRKRFFMIGNREGFLFKFPEQTHVDKAIDDPEARLFSNDKAPYVTSWDAIGGIENPPNENLIVRGRWADLLPSIPEGENYLWHTSRKGGANLFGWRARYWNFLLKLAKNKPSWTIQAQPGPAVGPFHWDNRRLSIRELAKLQTFPVDIEFMGSRTSIQKQIGNAVPSLLSEIIARAIAEQFFSREFVGNPSLSVKLNRPIPAPESIRPVPRRYLSLEYCLSQ